MCLLTSVPYLDIPWIPSGHTRLSTCGGPLLLSLSLSLSHTHTVSRREFWVLVRSRWNSSLRKASPGLFKSERARHSYLEWEREREEKVLLSKRHANKNGRSDSAERSRFLLWCNSLLGSRIDPSVQGRFALTPLWYSSFIIRSKCIMMYRSSGCMHVLNIITHC